MVQHCSATRSCRLTGHLRTLHFSHLCLACRMCRSALCLGPLDLVSDKLLITNSRPLTNCHRPGISTASRLLRLQSFLLEPASAFILLTLLLSSLDSWLYGHGAFLSTAPTFAPLNALLYNLDSSNLATHGTHPRWLHVCVNAPIILGVPQCLDAVERAVKWCTSRKAQRSRNRKGKGKEVELDEAQVLSNSMRKREHSHHLS